MSLRACLASTGKFLFARYVNSESPSLDGLFFYGVFMAIAYSYRRFSSKAQEQGDSIRRQTELAEQYCLEHQLDLSTQTYEDLGVSAWTGSNAHEDAGLGQFLLACQQGKIPSGSVLLVESLDRLSRDKIKKAMLQLMGITDHVDVVTLIDNRRYTSEMDLSDFIIAGATMQRANEESEVKSKRLSAVWEAKRRDPKNSKKTRKCHSGLM
ncbi:recombinase [Vibrio sp. JCM 19236]|nr:recombinase [Vibrio sp. JCM 19236]